MGIKTFFLQELTGVHRFSLRRFSSERGCVDGWIHQAMATLGDHPASFAPQLHEGQPISGDIWSHNDSRWPTTCSKCTYAFRPEDNWQFFVDSLYERFDTKEVIVLQDAPTGAMWFADWMKCLNDKQSVDGHVLSVRLPGNHDWIVEQRASNCDSPCALCAKPYHQHRNGKGELTGYCDSDGSYGKGSPSYKDAKPHFCWVRHGTPPHEKVHVDKSGVTCGAGAGSIATGSWHGFLHNGELVG